jgi:hypothetical protein
MFTNNLSAHDFVDMVLECGDFARNFFNAVKGHDANFSIFQGHSIAAVTVVHDAIQANDFASHLKASHLVTAVFGRQASFEEACANGIQGGELIPIAEQVASPFDFASGGHHLVQLLKVGVRQAHGHAEFA